MTRFHASGRVGGRNPASMAALIASILLTALLAAACGDNRATASPSASPSSVASGSPDGSSGPNPTPWPGNAVLGIEALGAADGQILAAVNDLNRGIQEEDLALIRRAADGLAGLDVLLPNLDRIDIYPPMVPFADQYGAAIRGIIAAAKEARSAIDAQDAGAITTSTEALVESIRAYTDVQPQLASWVEQSIRQRRLLLR
jgi:hypothetical protein